MITEIIIEGSRLDLYEDIGLELNLAIDDIKDFSSRNTTYSKTIIVPGNANNNKVFGHIYSLNSANNYGINVNNPSVGYNFDPTKQTDAKIFVNKIQIFKGVLRLMEIKIDKGVIEYECVVFGELGGFASAIANKTLEDQDLKTHFAQYNQDWTDTNVRSSWDASGTGIVFPLIDYGNCKHGSAVDYHLNAFRPAFFVYELIDKIIDYSGYTYSSSFINTSFFRSLILPNIYANLEQVRANLLNAQAANIVIDQPDELLTFNSTNLYLFTIASSNTFTFTGTTGTIGTFVFQGYGTVVTQRQVNIKLYQNTTVLWTGILADNDDTLTEFYFNEDITATLTNGDTITVEVTTNPGSNPNYEFISENLMLDFNSDNLVPVPAEYGSSLSMPDLLPKGILQKDFFLSICRMFNLYVYEDKDIDSHIVIEPFIDFYQIGGGFIKIDDFGDLVLHGEPGDTTGLILLDDPVAEAIDWTNKVDRNASISIKPMSEINARWYDFLYTSDDDYFNEAYNKKYSETYADRKEDTGFQFAQDRTDVQLIFAPSILVARTGDVKLCAALYNLTDNVEETRDNVLRIMQYKKITGVPSWHIKEVSPDSGNLGSAVTYYGYAGHLDHPTTPTTDINFAVPKELLFSLSSQYPTANLFTAFWGDYLAEIVAKDSKLLTCYLYLNLEDIYSLDFSKLILIDGSLWRLNKVIDFNPSVAKTTQVELLRVIELTYA